ncbi:MAG: DUF2905 domain-containing protein [Candidatus Omnitrophota bacterium]|nr:DUF2905 domain-containing protein [Candidatus Omnitrophota bacterium]
MNNLGKLLMFAGLILIIAGALFSFAGKIPFLGKLPGDIYFQRKNFTFYLPLATSILISIVLSLIIWLINKR